MAHARGPRASRRAPRFARDVPSPVPRPEPPNDRGARLTLHVRPAPPTRRSASAGDLGGRSRDQGPARRIDRITGRVALIVSRRRTRRRAVPTLRRGIGGDDALARQACAPGARDAPGAHTPRNTSARHAVLPEARRGRRRAGGPERLRAHAGRVPEASSAPSGDGASQASGGAGETHVYGEEHARRAGSAGREGPGRTNARGNAVLRFCCLSAKTQP